MSTEDKIKKILVDKLSVAEDEIVPEASFIDDLGADSLDLVELIMSMEEEFNIEISDEDAEMLATVGDAIDYINSSGKKVPAGEGSNRRSFGESFRRSVMGADS